METIDSFGRTSGTVDVIDRHKKKQLWQESSSAAAPPDAGGLPPNWEEHKDATGKVFYYNEITKETSRAKPKGAASPAPSPLGGLPPDGKEHKDPGSGKTLYYTPQLVGWRRCSVQASGISAAAPATLSPCPVSRDSDDDAWSLVSSVSSTPEAQEDMERITGDKLELEKELCKDQAAEKQARLLAEQKHAAALEAERKLQSVLQAMEQLRADHQRVTEEKEEEARLRAEAEMRHAAVAKEMQKLQEDHSRLKANKDAEEKASWLSLVCCRRGSGLAMH
ncbi:unnamed protein product [Symbiodinium microadriaticum]|nr:unnamed protein product [Symbiodinium microadriaticum]CAE7861956.1 unnamed protein product [Symbiodinium sp. KB8]